MELDKKATEEFTFLGTDPLTTWLQKIIGLCVRFLAILMVFVIILGVVNVVSVLYDTLINHPPFLLIDVNKFLEVLGSFLAVLVALEIFMNIVFYLQKDSVHVPLVLSTALTAIARKVIVLDYTSITSEYIYATGAVVFAVGIVYWLVAQKFLVRL